MYEHLTTLFNLFVEFSYIPVQLKTSVIFPLYKGKKKPKDDVSSYRGVSLTPSMSKIFEILIFTRLKPWLSERNFPPKLQHAGQSGQSSITLSYSVQEIINHFCQKNSKVYGCFLDIERAFDCIWWNCLLYKLSAIGIKDKLWWLFRECLNNSKSCVLINGTYSTTFDITRSIKQGGLLSVLFFVVAYHDIHSFVSQSDDSLKYYDQDVAW